MNLTRQQMTMVAILLFGAFLAVLNQTLLTPALPTIMENLSVDATTVQWLTSGYSLVEAIVIPLNAFLLGRFPTRRLFICGMALFMCGSVLCGVAPSFALLMLGRVLQAVATGVMMPMVFTLLLLIFPRETRGVAMGMVGLIVAFAPAIGPSVSGVLVDTVGWRMLFALVAAIALVVLVGSVAALRNFEGFERTGFDAASVALLLVGMVCLLYGLSTFTSTDLPAASAALMAIGAAVLAVFVRRQLGLETPVLRMRVLGYREFRFAVIAIAFLEAALIGGGVLLPLYIQNAHGESATVSGLLMLPGAVLGAAFSLVAGRVFDKRGVRGIAVAGGLVMLLGAVGYFTFSEDTPLPVIGAVYTVFCIGLQMLITPLNTWGMNSLPNRAVAHGNAIVATIEQVGASFGTAFVMSLTALWPLLVPAGAAEPEKSYAGCHIAFLGVIGLVAVVALVILLFVRDGTREGRQAAPGPVDGAGRQWLVSDFMNAHPSSVSRAATVRDAVLVMQREKTNGLPVVGDGGRVVGFLSDGDVLRRLSSNESSRESGAGYELLDLRGLQERLGDLLDAGVMELATKAVVSVGEDDRADGAFRILVDRHIKKVPVLRDGVLVGSLSRTDIIARLSLERGDE